MSLKYLTSPNLKSWLDIYCNSITEADGSMDYDYQQLTTYWTGCAGDISTLALVQLVRIGKICIVNIPSPGAHLAWDTVDTLQLNDLIPAAFRPVFNSETRVYMFVEHDGLFGENHHYDSRVYFGQDGSVTYFNQYNGEWPGTLGLTYMTPDAVTIAYLIA